MGWLSKLGKIALTAAPYVAAPFTGGASLLATGAANKAVQKWSEHDAKKNLAKGLAPSKFDSVLGKIGTGASMASMFIPGGQLGMLGKAGDVASKTGGASKFLGGLTGAGGGGWQGMLGSMANTAGTNALDKIGGGSPQEMPPQAGGLAPSSFNPMPFGNFNPNMGQRRRLGFGNA